MAAAAFLTPYRAAGYVTDSTPVAVHRQGGETFAVTSVGRSFQIYNCANLRLRFVGPQLPGRIRALQVHGDRTFAAIGGDIHVVQRAEVIGVLRGHARPVRHLVWLGELLVSVCAGRLLNGWLVLGKGAELDVPALTLQLPADLSPSAVLHPATYLNKLLVGCSSGALELWNVRSARRVYRFEGWGSAVSALAQSTAVDVVAIGLESGKVHVHNIREDALLFSFSMDGGAIRALAFRTDGVPILASASDRGHVALWQLDARRLASQVEFAHEAQVCTAHFLAGEPVLLTSGADNALKMWLFDQPSGGARLLRSRSGHASAPTRVRFYSDGITAASAGAAGASDLLSAGSDRSFRRTSLWLQQQDSELTQGHVIAQARKRGRNTRPSHLKLSQLTSFDAAALRERDWANVVGTHAGSAAASTWQTTRRALGKLSLVSPAGASASDATAACVSRCGNFAFVGYASGRIDKYNMQSGLHRGSFGAELGRAAAGAALRAGAPLLTDSGAHRGAVRGVAIDSTQRLLVSAGHDGTVRVWSVHSRELVACMPCDAPVAHLAESVDSSLVAVACDDLRVRVFDVRSFTLVRQFEGHARAITDVAFTPDGRQLLTASLDGSLRLVDLPTARLVGWHTLSMPATSISWSPRGEFLATTHAGCVALCVWASRALFANAALECAVTAPAPLEMPAGALGGGADEDDDGDGEGVDDGERALSAASAEQRNASRSLAAAAQRAADEASSRDALRSLARPAQLSKGLPTLSSLPPARWQALNALDEIQARNQPEQPPDAPPDAPFFLTTRPGLEPEFELATTNAAKAGDGLAATGDGGAGEAGVDGDGREGKRPRSRVLSPFAGASKAAPLDEAELLRHMRRGAQQGSYAMASEYLRGLSPSAADLQLRLLGAGDGSGLADAVDFFAAQVGSRADYELTQALLARFFKIHSAAIRADAELSARCAALREEQRAAWSALEALFHEDLALLSFLSHMQG
ncbi:hypothetical protein KFE25_006295 [Diacronema lutheri]|uniref:Small-subunit processome Utp21 domain-containing protein n=2 Tax=Diacronema lutheri TaxID=2081491 RepID=A0A8J5Y1V3_DIALT|nr:hypothetical protein KFE25_006295 [Diacronema lutheri]